ncbi:nitrate/nitrite transporter [Antarcticirhabdus aurantiaca]|uniref:MFS transporter n=1 Tax=Antarcticirhabdus aurantiaca TaxID=2606717 RepID=A0ACD4NMP8_9HYPH|nr:MFS transporter [Antarcticirhabdus aurantiaca]WAJ28158.1 MFS transporter [Jeongeuplla avenae]
MAASVTSPDSTADKADQVLWTSTVAFTASFAVWTIFAIIGIGIKDELGLSESQFGLLVGTPILSGSLSRLVLGMWSDRYGGRKIFAALMFVSAAATWALIWADSYPTMLLAGLVVGLAGGTFSVGVPYVSRFFSPERQGTALGIFGAGNVGAAVTKFLAPFVMVAMGWRGVAQVWAVGLVVTAVVFLILTKDEPRRAGDEAAAREPFTAQFKVLVHAQVWRFSLYYFFAFGAFVALSLWLPHYLVTTYGLSLTSAGMLAAFYSVPASLFRIYGGVLSDRYGARAVLYWTFAVGIVATFMLSYPPTTYIIEGIQGPIRFSTSMGLTPFLVIMFVLGFFMSLGKAAVFKHVPIYYPREVGAVSGLVGMIGGLGGFLLPIAFGVLEDLTGVRTACFALLFLVAVASLVWMHVSVQKLDRDAASRREAGGAPARPVAATGSAPIPAAPDERLAPAQGAADSHLLTDWRPDDPVFWEKTGRAIARRNLWISTYCLALAFAVWQLWSIVVAWLPAAGFQFTSNQLFWLAAAPGISGATLRIFYSFLVPVFGGRLWTALSTGTLLIPAFGIGYAVQDPQTPYLIFLTLALLCGFGGGNFASSVSNISFFFPKTEKGRALAINSGIGNLGVSVVQLLVPIVISMGIFGTLAGNPQTTPDGASVWLQNAGFVWVPLILVGVGAAWFGMNNIASAKASFTEQLVIVRHLHTWVMCWLYTGTFGTFIGMSAAFPLLTRLVFPQVDALHYAFIGPLVGALSRAFSGGLSDRLGGERVTFWVFVSMIVFAVLLVWSLEIQSFPAFFAMTLLLFFASGIGNASTFQMVPGIMTRVVDAQEPQASAEERRHKAEWESAAVTGFISAIAAYGGFFIPKALGTSIDVSGSANGALYGFAAFFITCALATWFFYTGPRGLFRTTERRA